MSASNSSMGIVLPPAGNRECDSHVNRIKPAPNPVNSNVDGVKATPDPIIGTKHPRNMTKDHPVDGPIKCQARTELGGCEQSGVPVDQGDDSATEPESVDGELDSRMEDHKPLCNAIKDHPVNGPVNHQAGTKLGGGSGLRLTGTPQYHVDDQGDNSATEPESVDGKLDGRMGDHEPLRNAIGDHPVNGPVNRQYHVDNQGEDLATEPESSDYELDGRLKACMLT
ncbi:hypothetical protein EDB89DRAFT_2075710 [Lactarius sanguifluus]|nr:hypothetical protein EDB89DRAFT_2075710 [Lactarius sanguifluus]